MPYTIEVRPLAAIEILDAFDWYEEQLEGLGSEFLEELDRLYDTLNINPFTYSFYEKPVRQGKINRFPYTVVYEIFDQVIVIYSVFMFRQDPEKKRTK